MVFLDWRQAVDLAEAHSDPFRARVDLVVELGMRWSERIGLRHRSVNLRTRKVGVDLLKVDAG